MQKIDFVIIGKLYLISIILDAFIVPDAVNLVPFCTCYIF